MFRWPILTERISQTTFFSSKKKCEGLLPTGMRLTQIEDNKLQRIMVAPSFLALWSALRAISLSGRPASYGRSRRPGQAILGQGYLPNAVRYGYQRVHARQ